MISVFDRVKTFVGKGENTGYYHFLLFPQCFLNSFFLGFIKSSNCVLTHSHTMTPFDAPGKQAYWKHCQEKENLHVMSNFSFSHSVFYLFG